MRLFTVIDAVMLRLATRLSDVDERDWPDLTGEHVPQWRDWLTRAWADEAFAYAVEAASPDLARRVIAVCAGYEQRPRQVRGAVVSILRYRLRASSRATPFGLFAGVAPAAFGSATTVRIGDDHRATARVDAVWLAGVVTELEHSAPLAGRLPVVLNNVTTLRDGRLVVGLRQHPAPAMSRTDPAEVSVRHTRAIEVIVRAARTPIRLDDLAALLGAEFPSTPQSVIAQTLGKLVNQRVLISSLRPPMTATDPLGHVLTALVDADVEEVPAAMPLLGQLRDLHAHLAEHDRTADRTKARELRTTVTRAMSDVAGTDRPLAVDLRADAELVLPRAVAAEATRATAALARLTPHPFGKPVWLDYHARFLERYGIGAAVPLLELVNPDIGLGFPAGYRDSLLERPAPRVSERDAALLQLAQNTALDRRVEIVLDDAAIAELEADNLGRAQWPPHTELAVQVHAPSRATLDRGEFELAVSGAFRAAGTTTGRFLDLLDAAERNRMARAYAGMPTVNDGALRVQVSCPPLYAETENVARSHQVLSDLLAVSEHRAEDVLVPEDLVVIGDAHRFYLWSRSRARPVEPEVFSAVEFTNVAHPLLRFLCEVSTARAAVCGPFSWGMAGQLPFLPRLRYRRAILAPARWTLSAADLPDRRASWPDWTAGVARWRDRMMVPAAVCLGGNDQRIRLDLDEPAHLYLLRTQLDRHGHATVHEASAADAFGWLDGYAHEIIVPLAAIHARTWPPIPPRTTPLAVTTAQDGHLPGASEWLFCKLYGHPDRHTALLTNHLSELLSTWDEPLQWWFLPYRDPDNHLRLRVRLPDAAAFGLAVAQVGTWVARLRRLGLIATMQLDTYRPETGRFGSGTAMTAAETVFAADSAAAIAQRAHLAGSDAADARALTAASLLDLAAAFTGGTAEGAAWMIEHISTDLIPALDRTVYNQALRLANPRDNWAAVQQLPGGEQIALSWTQRRTTLAAYRKTLASAGELAPASVLASLLHLHCLRTSGIAPETERTCHRLARAAALSQIAYAEVTP
ncbi:lantibiotic dehydratase [Actinocrispum sp. NPDC049592]|uniref:lantibiotic dehydratase n=1 Tax=Actinocrispum sp. NPDC049592 TaxID=3154835 RepID=UPI00343AAB4A